MTITNIRGRIEGWGGCYGSTWWRHVSLPGERGGVVSKDSQKDPKSKDFRQLRLVSVNNKGVREGMWKAFLEKQ